VNPENEEENASAKCYSLLRNACGKHSTTNDGKPCAKGVANESTESDAKGILLRRECNSGDLRSITPLGEKRQSKGLRKDLEVIR
jgi:hypothetical protein